MYGTCARSGRFAFLTGDDGVCYFAPQPPPDLSPGDVVNFSVDPTEAPDPGRKPRAFDVHLEMAVTGRDRPAGASHRCATSQVAAGAGQQRLSR